MNIQVSIAGFADQPCTLIGVLDEQTGVLVIAKSIPFRENRADESMAFIANIDTKDLDWRFSDDHLRAGIGRYFARKDQDLLAIQDSVTRFIPDSRLEMDGVDEKGRNYRIASDITNGQIAVLAMVAYADRQTTMADCQSFCEQLSDIYKPFSI